jgi:mRNA interferase RelE/StbE
VHIAASYIILMRVVTYDPEALRTLRRMPRNVSDRIRGKLSQLAADPDSLSNNLTALKGTRALRLRVGDWRAILSIDTQQITVHQVGPRGSIYR